MFLKSNNFFYFQHSKETKMYNSQRLHSPEGHCVSNIITENAYNPVPDAAIFENYLVTTLLTHDLPEFPTAETKLHHN